MLFNRNFPSFGNTIEEPSQDAIENSLNLRQVSLEDAVRYGGSITRAALGAMNFRGDRKNIIVDTKVHFLMPGMAPSIPGWHTDGVPRGESLDPAGSGEPVVSAMESGEVTEPIYHLLVTGSHAPTAFADRPFYFDVDDLSGRDLYKGMTEHVDSMLEAGDMGLFYSHPSRVLTWDWWTVHSATMATGRGWRYLIRVTETDHITPRTNPADFIRTQNNVYVPTAYGW